MVQTGIHGEETLANKLLKEFPDQIPGSADIEKHEFPGASHCLIHIKQLHYSDDSDEEEMRDLKEVQNHIYSTLCWLIDNYSLCEIYQEGVSDDREAIVNQVCELARLFDSNPLEKRGEIMKQKGGFLPLLMLEGKHLWWTKYLLAMDKNPDDILYPGAAIKLAYENKLIIKTTGTSKTNEIASLLREKCRKGVHVPQYLLDYFLLHKRHQELLERVDGIMPVTVFGFNHDLCKDIDVWNASHPGKRISLIEITPVWTSGNQNCRYLS